MENLSRTSRDYDGKIVLVTGGLGFIGSNLVHILAAHSTAEVRVVDSLNPACGGDVRNLVGVARRVAVHTLDLRDTARLSEVVRGVDVVFNLAGQVSHSDSMKDPVQDMRANVEAQLSLLQVCRKQCPGGRVVYASTRQCYGRSQILPVGEDHPIIPLDINGANKFAAECYHTIYNKVYDLETCSLRLTNTYGPRQMIRSPRQGVIGWFVHEALCNRTVKVFGDGKQIRDLNYVDCVVEALLRAGVHPKAPGRIFNLGSDEPMALIDVAELIIAVAGKGRCEIVPFPEDRKRIDIGSYHADCSRIRRQLGWRPRISVRQGLSQTISFFEKNRSTYLDVETSCMSHFLSSGANQGDSKRIWSGFPIA